ncbi:Sec-independent protein translocase subunit TatA [Allostreptomyces psammosilenae]|uniref:Sec-independent protein translocase protein TatA n=1 Tax=Allostreptomyces psammosilenae TaxID=1892865 RepID=A0A852ZNM5_9ACTN|nr:Sec-independent protein translocase subunit TatA [Allostreptomyces psammosilenae]NYI03999.1 sec-independent protein translocase protein TatA [Allostreptomyces psammosilenae]
MLGRLGPGEIVMIIIAVIILFGLFGAKRLPDAARSIGKSMRILRSETKAMREESKKDSDTPEPAAQPATVETQRTIQAAPGDVSTARVVSESGQATTPR